MDVQLQVDVTEAAGLGEPADVALTVTVPDELGIDPLVCFGKPGGGYARGYYTEDLPGPGSGAQAAWHAERGWIFVSVDHLGVGDSSVHDSERLTYTPVVAASQAAETEVLQKLAAGTLIDGFPRVERPVTIGIGQSMGGALLVVQQGRYHCYDGIGVLGYSAVHTHPPTAPGTAPLAMPWMPRDTMPSDGVVTNGPACWPSSTLRRCRAPRPWPGASTTTTSTPSSSRRPGGLPGPEGRRPAVGLGHGPDDRRPLVRHSRRGPARGGLRPLPRSGGSRRARRAGRPAGRAVGIRVLVVQRGPLHLPEDGTHAQLRRHVGADVAAYRGLGRLGAGSAGLLKRS